jgi:outer membrane receptor protein involved in Fe transport
VNAGVSYRLNAPIDVTGTLVAKWISGYRTGPPFADDPTTGPAPAKPKLGGHTLVDANIIYRATTHLGFELMVRNLLDTNYKLPQGGIAFVPMPRRSFHLTLSYNW